MRTRGCGLWERLILTGLTAGLLAGCAPVPVEGEAWISPATGMEFVWIDELGVWAARHEVTNGEFRWMKPGHHIEPYTGHGLNGDRQPVGRVTFEDAQRYARWMTERDQVHRGLPEGYRYRLPTGDEWMVLAQCGDGRRYPWGDPWPPPSGKAGNYHGREGAGTGGRIEGYYDGHPVTAPVEALWHNSWGLSGVGGNVWEATTKTPFGQFDAWRGGSWKTAGEEELRCSYRRTGGAAGDDNAFGFRLLLSR